MNPALRDSLSASRESAAAHGIPGNSGRNLLCPVSEDAPAATRSREQLDGCLVAGEGGRKVSEQCYLCPKCGRMSPRDELTHRWDGAGNLRITWQYSCDYVKTGKGGGYRYLHFAEEVLSRADGLVYLYGAGAGR